MSLGSVTCIRIPSHQFELSRRASKVMGCTFNVLRFTSTMMPVLENLGMQSSLTFCPSRPAHAGHYRSAHSREKPLPHLSHGMA